MKSEYHQMGKNFENKVFLQIKSISPDAKIDLAKKYALNYIL